MLALGDSYSSGEGTRDSAKDCGVSPTAYPELVAATLDGGTVELTVETCSGAKLSDVAAQLDAVGDERFDIVTLSVGGNDAGFASLLADCIGVDDAMALIGDDDTADGFSLRDCDQTPDELDARARSLSGELAAFYQRIVDDHLAPDGRLVVVGYPRLLAPSAEWEPDEGERCDGITRGDADALGDAAAVLDEVIRGAVEPLGDRAAYVDAAAAFEGHERCTAEPWLQGFTLRPRLRSSFHPNEAGHEAIAAQVSAALQGGG